MGRLLEMEQRINGLEDRLAKALDEVQEARSRELGVISVMREVVVHLAAVERGESCIMDHCLTRRIGRLAAARP